MFVFSCLDYFHGKKSTEKYVLRINTIYMEKKFLNQLSIIYTVYIIMIK